MNPGRGLRLDEGVLGTQHLRDHNFRIADHTSTERRGLSLQSNANQKPLSR